MEQPSIYIQLAGAAWVIGCSFFAFKKADLIVQKNAKLGKKVERTTVRELALFTMTLGVIGVFILVVQCIVDYFRKGHS
jgi:hypothetical protein